jgi:hypothetical protein
MPYSKPVSTVAGNATIGGSYKFDDSTVAANPGNKNFRVDNAVLAAVTNIFVNDFTVNGFDISTIASFLVLGNRLYIQQKDDPTRAALFAMAGPGVNNIGWWTLPVSVVANGGLLYTKNKECVLMIMLTPP